MSFSPLRLAAYAAALSMSASVLALQAQAYDSELIVGTQDEAKSDAGQWGVSARSAALSAQAEAKFGFQEFAQRPIAQGQFNGRVDFAQGPDQSGPGLVEILTAGGITGAGVIVAVVDTGVDITHPEFAGRILTGTCIGGPSACPAAVQTGDDNAGHGSHVAGIIAAADNGIDPTGVAPGAFILPVKVLDSRGRGDFGTIAQGITWAANHGAQVINMSLGGGGGSTALLSALAGASDTTVLVAAAGNSGNRRTPLYPAAYATDPSVGGSMLIVGSVNRSNVISRFSNTPGSGGCKTSAAGTFCFKDFFVVAPGENIYSTYKDGRFATLSGTSMATPFVAGTAALILEDSPFLTPSDVVEIIKLSARDLGATGVDGVYGWGLVDPAAALGPVGGASVATGGGMTASFSGTGQISRTRLSGPFMGAIGRSTLLPRVTTFDAFGRDFGVNLAAPPRVSGFSFASFTQPNATAFEHFGFAGEGITASAFFAADDSNIVRQAGFAPESDAGIRDFVVSMALTPDTTLTVGNQAGLRGRFNALDIAASDAYDGLFAEASALNSPYLGLTDGGSFASVATRVSDSVSVSFGQSMKGEGEARSYTESGLRSTLRDTALAEDFTHQRAAGNTMASASYQFAPWGTIGAVVSYTDEGNSLLGSEEAGALALTAEAQTMSAGFGARASLGEGWVASASWSVGQSQVTPLAGGLFADVTEVASQAYGIALSKRGVFEDDDAIGFAISRPLHITDGAATVTASVGVTNAREIVYASERLNLASETPETQYEAGYTMRLSDMASLQFNAMVQQDLAGVAGENAVAGMLRLNVAF